MDLLLDAVNYPIVTISVSGVMSLELPAHTLYSPGFGAKPWAEKALKAEDTTEFDRCARRSRGIKERVAWPPCDVNGSVQSR
jgi:hypothetical protein